MIVDRYLHIGHYNSSVLYVYYLHLWKQYDVFVHIKSSLYYRYNLSRTQLWDWWVIFTLFTFTLQYWMSITYTYESNTCICAHKNLLYYRYNLSRTQLWDWWGIFTLFTFTLQYWMSITYTYERNTMYLCT